MRERYSYAFRALGNRAPAGPADAPDRSPDMRSRARFLKGLPIHPMLAPFPLAFGIGACVFDLVGLQLGLPGWYTAGRYLLGGALVGGLVAAVPGLVDFFWSIPRGGVARRRARRHMFVSGAALPLAWLAFWVRGGPLTNPDNSSDFFRLFQTDSMANFQNYFFFLIVGKNHCRSSKNFQFDF